MFTGVMLARERAMGPVRSLNAGQIQLRPPQTPSAYAAREVLDDPLGALHEYDLAALAELVRTAGLRAGTIPDPLRSQLHAAVLAAGTVLTRTLRIMLGSGDCGITSSAQP
jgi:hypothetical protein